MRRLTLAVSIAAGAALCSSGACSSTTESGQGGASTALTGQAGSGATGNWGGGSPAGGAGGACQGNVQKATFWPTLCAIAAACEWIDPVCHPELECSEAECNERHAGDQPPSVSAPYLAAFETCVNDAASCLRCTALRDCYGGLELSELPCELMVRCGLIYETVTECQASLLDLADGAGKFDAVIPLYCLNELAADSLCTEVEVCLGGGA